MALVRELIRQERTGLGLVCLVGGIAVDWLSAAGVLDRFIGAAVSMEQFGLCQQYRKAVESGRIRVEELSETALNARLGAGARNLPFLPTRGMLGTDLIDLNENLVRCSRTRSAATTVVACRALVPDVAFVHAHRADSRGNVQIEPTIRWPDLGIFPKAAKKVVVTAEEIVDTEVLRRNPDRTVLPGFVGRRGRRGALRGAPDLVLPRLRLRHGVPPRMGAGRPGRRGGGRRSSTATSAGPATQPDYLAAVAGRVPPRRADALMTG